MFDSISVTDQNAGQLGFVNVFCDKSNVDNVDSTLACEYFSLETDLVNLTTYRSYVRLIKKLDYKFKKNFIVPLRAQPSAQPTLFKISYLVVELAEAITNQSPTFLNSTYLIHINKYIDIVRFFSSYFI